MSLIDDAEMMETVRFGIEVEAFLEGKIGKYLVQRAREEVQEALNQLKTVSPDASSLIRELQGIVHRGECFESWLAEAIQEGWNTEQNIRRMEE